jgi:hypothetical protein
MVNAFLIPLLDAKPINLTDGWDPARVLRLMETYGVVPGGGAPYYMSSLLNHPDTRPSYIAMLKYSGMGGAPVPPSLSLRLEEGPPGLKEGQRRCPRTPRGRRFPRWCSPRPTASATPRRSSTAASG